MSSSMSSRRSETLTLLRSSRPGTNSPSTSDSRSGRSSTQPESSAGLPRVSNERIGHDQHARLPQGATKSEHNPFSHSGRPRCT